MMTGQHTALRAAVPHDLEFAASVIEGLSQPQKHLSCRFFYDRRGSSLFEEITRLPEYYLTRAETAILAGNAAAIASGVPDGAALVEFGSGSSSKTEILLAALPELSAYVPIDVSRAALEGARQRLKLRFPGLAVRPVLADFSADAAVLPPDLAEAHKLGFFPGSTIGNFAPGAAIELLRHMGRILAPQGRLIAGADLQKDPGVLLRAYDDPAGVTAAFNLNLLERINRELEGTFDPGGFRHAALYNPREGRIEMHLVSQRPQSARVCGRWFHFRAGESIHTENSYKYTVPQFQELARMAGWRPGRVWRDSENLFSVHELMPDA
jgi:dimethylhistidine N-methyltransferase